MKYINDDYVVDGHGVKRKAIDAGDEYYKYDSTTDTVEKRKLLSAQEVIVPENVQIWIGDVVMVLPENTVFRRYVTEEIKE